MSKSGIFCEVRSNHDTVLGAMSKALATIVTQPLIVAKVVLQSATPPERRGKPLKTFGEVMRHIINHEGPLGLFKGIGPQILKGLLVQGVLMMIKERMELLFVVLFANIRRIRYAKMKQAADAMKSRGATASDQISEKARSMNLKGKADSVASKTLEVTGHVSDKAKNFVPITAK